MIFSFPMTFLRYDDSLNLSYEQEEPAPPAPSRENQSCRQIGQNNKQPWCAEKETAKDAAMILCDTEVETKRSKNQVFCT